MSNDVHFMRVDVVRSCEVLDPFYDTGSQTEILGVRESEKKNFASPPKHAKPGPFCDGSFFSEKK
jgi:hypothetical protein